MKPDRFLLPSALLSTWLVQRPAKRWSRHVLSAVGWHCWQRQLTVRKRQGGANPALTPRFLEPNLASSSLDSQEWLLTYVPLPPASQIKAHATIPGVNSTVGGTQAFEHARRELYQPSYCPSLPLPNPPSSLPLKAQALPAILTLVNLVVPTATAQD